MTYGEMKRIQMHEKYEEAEWKPLNYRKSNGEDRSGNYLRIMLGLLAILGTAFLILKLTGR